MEGENAVPRPLSAEERARYEVLVYLLRIRICTTASRSSTSPAPPGPTVGDVYKFYVGVSRGRVRFYGMCSMEVHMVHVESGEWSDRHVALAWG